MKPNELLTQHFGFSEFRPGQQRVVEGLLSGKNALAVFPTGGGKSLCYQLPALALDGVTVVVSPLIALMKDQIDFLRRRGIQAARLDSSLSLAEAMAVGDRLNSRELKILYVAPERFNNERFLGQLRRVDIALFAIDEAHCISEWGHNFRPDYLKLAEMARELSAQRVLALTATATPSVVRDICTAFDIPDETAVVTGFYRPNLDIEITPVTPRERDSVLINRLRERPPGSGIIYVTLQKTAEQVAEALSNAGFQARAYHAGLDPEVRGEVQEWWSASDRGIVVATIAFGMGIDKSDVRYVYHYNLPKSLESYSQEIGRAGRDDQPCTVELLACAADVPVLENFAYGDTPTLGALRGLAQELLSGDPELALNLYELSARHDLRPLVLRTALTYLELDGILRQGTPFFAGYELRPLISIPEIIAKFNGEPAQLVQSLFDFARKGRIWYAINPDDAAAALGKERKRIVRALDYLAEHGWVELKTADVRHRYTRLTEDADAGEIAQGLMNRFLTREQREIERLSQVLQLVTADACVTNALAAHFGEERSHPCGHCSHCRITRAQNLPAAGDPAPLPQGLDVTAFRSLRAANPEALGEPRQAARFLCGLTSPALTRAKLSRHRLFGAWEDRRFSDVLAWCGEG